MAKNSTYTGSSIVDESQELSVGESPLLAKFFSAFPALSKRNYQLYFSGQLISITGTWIQQVAQSWLVLELTHSAFWVGTMNAVANLPTLIFALFAGVLVDRVSRKRIIFAAETTSMTLAFILGILAYYHMANLLEIGIIIFLMGTVSAIDIPARQAFVVEMVGKRSMQSAIALNSGLFNAARVIGPSIAGFLIALYGSGGAFVINGLSFIPVLIALYFIKPLYLNTKKQESHPIQAIKEGLQFAFQHQLVKTLLIMTALCSLFDWSYVSMLPVITQNTYHMDASGLGYLYAAAGLGAVLGTIAVSASNGRIRPAVFLVGGMMLFSLSIIAFTMTTFLPFAFFSLFLAGLGITSQFSTINSEIQHSISDHLRGRVMSIWTLMFLGVLPFGSFEVGIIADKFSPQVAISSGAIVTLLYGIYLFFSKKLDVPTTVIK